MSNPLFSFCSFAVREDVARGAEDRRYPVLRILWSGAVKTSLDSYEALMLSRRLEAWAKGEDIPHLPKVFTLGSFAVRSDGDQARIEWRDAPLLSLDRAEALKMATAIATWVNGGVPEVSP